MRTVLIVVAMFAFVATGCGGADDNEDSGTPSVSCAKDGVCESVCANDPDCPSSGGGSGGSPGGARSGDGGESADSGIDAGSGTGGSGGSTEDAVCVPPAEPVPEPPLPCGGTIECCDGKVCTSDRCQNGKCTFAHTNEYCGSTDICDPRIDECVTGAACSADNGAECTDDDACTVNERCDLSLGVCRWEILDNDGDGHPPTDCGGDDFDDEDGNSYPGAVDICDGRDNDNNGVVDDEPEASRSCSDIWNEVPACKEGRCSQGCRSESDQQGLQYVHEECDIWDDPPCTSYTIPEMIASFGFPLNAEISFRQHGVTPDVLSQDCFECIVSRSICVYNCDCWLPTEIGPTTTECESCQIKTCIRPFEDCAGIPDLLLPDAPVCGQEGSGGAGGVSGSGGTGGAGGSGGSAGAGGSAGTGGAGGSGGSAGAGGSAGTGGAGGAECDNTGACNLCLSCAEAGPCASQVEACFSNADCDAFNTCFSSCSDIACEDECFLDHPDGSTLYIEMSMCMLCVACYNDCDGAAAGC